MVFFFPLPVNKCFVDLSDLGTKHHTIYPLPLSTPRSSQGFVIHTCAITYRKLLLSRYSTTQQLYVNMFFFFTKRSLCARQIRSCCYVSTKLSRWSELTSIEANRPILYMSWIIYIINSVLEAETKVSRAV